MIPLGVLASSYVAPAGGSYSAYGTAVMADSPTIYYPLDDATFPPVDVAGGSTASGTLWPTFGASGLGDGATSASFDGSNDTFSIGQPAALNGLSALTVEALISTSSQTTNIIASRDNTSTQRSWLLYNSGGKLFFAKVVNGSAVVDSNLSITGGVCHVAATYDGSIIRTYVNGTAGGTGSTTGSLGSPTVDLVIGSRNGALFWNGSMAGVAIYTSALSASRILAHAQAAGVA